MSKAFVPGRLHFIDVARAAAIALAIFQHAMIDFGGFNAIGIIRGPVELITRIATPLFVLMFGFMLEFVYTRRAERDGLGSVTPRLFHRAAQCYLGFVVTACAAVVGGRIELGDLWRSFVLLGPGGHSSILATYAILLALAPALLAFRLRMGAAFAPVLLAAVWVADALVLPHLDVAALGWAAMWGRRLFDIVAPSALHGLTFIAAGMWLAGGLAGWRERGLRTFYIRAAGLSALALAVLAVLAFDVGVAGVVESYGDWRQYRAHNAPGYYALGGLMAIGVLVGLSFVVPRDRLPAWSVVPLALGQHSLSAFAVGNALLSLIPPAYVARGLDTRGLNLLSIVGAVGLVLMVMAFVNRERIWGLVPARRQSASPVRDTP